LAVHTPLLVRIPRLGHATLTNCLLLLGRRPQLLCFLRDSVWLHELKVPGALSAYVLNTG